MRRGAEMMRPALVGGTWLAAAVCAGVFAHVAWLHGSAGGLVGCAAVVLVSARSAGMRAAEVVSLGWAAWLRRRMARARRSRREARREAMRALRLPLPVLGPWRLRRGGAGAGCGRR